jgi:hypothetical protein
MRFTLILSACMCVLALSPASAQQQQMQRAPLQAPAPQAQLLQEPTGRVLQNPTGQRFTAPALNPAQVNAERLRKIQLASRWGLSVSASAIGGSIFLNPQQSFIDANTNLAVNDAGSRVTTSYTPAAGLPWGSFTFTAPAPNTGAGAVVMRVPNPGPSTWWLVECWSPGRTGHKMSANFAARRPEGEEARPMIGLERYQNARDGREVFLFEPSTTPQRTFVYQNFRGDQDWIFGGCELTPIRP